MGNLKDLTVTKELKGIFQNMNRNEKIIRVAKRVFANKSLQMKLYATKNKNTIRKYVYDIVTPYTNGFFNDNDWSNVRKVFKALEQYGFETNYWAENGGYHPDGSSKTYEFELKFKNLYGTEFVFKGRLICSFCGSVQDPQSRYDMVFLFR